MPTSRQSRTADQTVLELASSAAWGRWLAANHASSSGVWLRLAKKGTETRSVTYAEALDLALAYGWIDGQRRAESDTAWLIRFTPRSKRSIWSKINREKALALIDAGRMKPAGLAEVERAKQDGRWEAAYAGQKGMSVPPDLEAALRKNARAKAFFASLDSKNRYAILFRIGTAKKPETRAKRLANFVEMLERGEKIH